MISSDIELKVKGNFNAQEMGLYFRGCATNVQPIAFNFAALKLT